MEEVLAPGWAGRLRGRSRGSVAPARDLFAARLGLGVALVGLWVARYVGATGFATGMLTRRRAYAWGEGVGGSCCEGCFSRGVRAGGRTSKLLAASSMCASWSGLLAAAERARVSHRSQSELMAPALLWGGARRLRIWL